MWATLSGAGRGFGASSGRWGLVLAVIAAGGCRSSGRVTPSAASLQPAPPPPSVAQEPDPPPADEPRKVEPPAEEPATITIQVPDRTRWYYVERYEPGTQPEAFEATFDRDRNKIDIQTAGVTQFTIDTSRIPIDWERLVILGIDGRNSELRRRDFDLLRFQKNKYGQWVVVEP